MKERTRRRGYEPLSRSGLGASWDFHKDWQAASVEKHRQCEVGALVPNVWTALVIELWQGDECQRVPSIPVLESSPRQVLHVLSKVRYSIIAATSHEQGG